tara:strand:+ start:1973 stop:2203 length:231 start_codon:yes stop_codon:yes gene_type:complete
MNKTTFRTANEWLQTPQYSNYIILQPYGWLDIDLDGMVTESHWEEKMIERDFFDSLIRSKVAVKKNPDGGTTIKTF